MRRPYAELTERGQISCLRPFAFEACSRFGLEEPKVKLLNHAFNTTFAISSGGRKFALRLNTNSNRTREELSAEIAWTSALSRERCLWVPKPRRTLNGEPFAVLDWPEHGRPLFAALYSWLPGHIADKTPTPYVGGELGRITSALHRQAAGMQFPAGAELQPFDHILFHKPLCLADRGYRGDLGVFKEVESRANAVLDRLSSEPRIPIHSDLHLANLMVCRKKVAVFDFDDSFMGHPLIDVGVSLFYLRRADVTGEMETSYWHGFGTPREDFADEAALEALVAGRGLMLCNELYDMKTASIIAMAPSYAAITETRLKHYLQTGRLDPNVAVMP